MPQVRFAKVETDASPRTSTSHGIRSIPTLALFRHGASLGGIGIVALMLQDRLGWRAGWVQLAFDAVLFAASFLVVPPKTVAMIRFLPRCAEAVRLKPAATV